tara:strand:- start:2715 stop:4100 length:1386 start_codon:yes stop_codon:yes gene_type:complete
MATNFPDSPSNGATHTFGGTTYTYNSTKGVWKASADAMAVSDTPPSSPEAGALWFDSSVAKSYIYYNDGSSAQWVQLNPSGGSDGADGTNATGDGESPIIYTEPATSHTLNTDGSTSTVQMQAVDPEGTAITYGIAYANSTNALPTQLASATTINQSTGTYTFTPTTTTSNAGTFKARLSASDGVGITTRFVNFSLTFLINAEMLLVGGGGGGNHSAGGGGGGGGYVEDSSYDFSPGTAYTITVGTGGAVATAQDAVGSRGGNTSIASGGTDIYVATGGGGGGGVGNFTGTDLSTALNGGSGGGAGRASDGPGLGLQASYGGKGFGNNGGDDYSNEGAGGGGGAGGAGTDGSAALGGNGGAAKQSSITGTATYYAGGGKAGGFDVGMGSYGTGGGDNVIGNGGYGGIWNNGSLVSKAGNDGVVIIAAPQAASAVTGTYTLDTSGRSGYHVYTFTGNGSITF